LPASPPVVVLALRLSRDDELLDLSSREESDARRSEEELEEVDVDAELELEPEFELELESLSLLKVEHPARVSRAASGMIGVRWARRMGRAKRPTWALATGESETRDAPN
jgi:hypothetical protein